MKEQEKRIRRKKQAADLSARERFCLDAYLLTEDADLCFQLATGRTEEDTKVETFHKMALRFIRLPHVKEYLDKRKTEINGRKDSAKKDTKGSYRSKDEVLDALVAELPYLRGKERADVLMKIADLQQLKKEETIEASETVHFYLPISCKDGCDLYRREQERLRKLREQV